MKRSTTLLAGLALATSMAVAADDDKKFTEVDADSDGRISRTEVANTWTEADVTETFARVDTDRDGYLNMQEYQQFQVMRSEQEEAE